MTAAAAAQRADPADAAALCTSCGLCCTGVLFNGAPAAPGEEPKLVGYGLELREVEGRTHFIFPCPQLRGTACGIYADRFVRCRDFRCELLKALDRGETVLDEALAAVSEARRLLGRVTALDPASALLSTRLRQRARGRPTPDEARLRVEGLALDTHLDRRFRARKVLAWGTPADAAVK